MGSSGINAGVHGVFQISCSFSISFSFVLGLRLGLEQAGNPFCLLVNSPWLLVFASLFYLLLMGLSLYCWKGIHFSWSLDILFILVFLGLIITLHFWFRDLLRELNKKYEILLMVLFLVFFYFLLLKLCYLYPSFGHLFIHYLLQL